MIGFEIIPSDEHRKVIEAWLVPLEPPASTTLEDAYAAWLALPGNEGKGVDDFKATFRPRSLT